MAEGSPSAARAAIQARQWEQLSGLLTTSLPGNPFYTKKLGPLAEALQARVSPKDAAARSAAEQLAEFSRLAPFTTKAEIVADQLEHPPYGTNLSFPLERYTRCHQTSGTTGTPLRWLDTSDDWNAMVEDWVTVYRAAGVKRGDRVLFAFSFGPFIGFWLAFEAAERLGALCLPGGGLGSLARLRMILDHAATVVCCTPTYALRLAESAAEHGIALDGSSVRTLLVAGEPGGSLPAVRERLARLWPGARVFDHHGMTETGPVTHECPACPGVLHVLESSFYAEVIDPATGEAAPAGASGELVLTTLSRQGSPLLRYRSGDLVRAAFGPLEDAPPPCACGRYELALAGGILGRTDDMIIVRGVNVFPSAVEEIVRGVDGVAEYQVTVTVARGLAEMALRVEPSAPGPNPGGIARQVQEALQAALSLRVPVVTVPPGTLPRFELKARRWVTVPDPGGGS